MHTSRRQIVTRPTLHALTQAELESHCRTLGATGADVTPYLFAAAEHIETICSRAFLTQTWKAYLDYWPHWDEIVLPLGWLQSVTHLKYYDTTGAATTVASDQYDIDLGGDGYGRLKLKYQKHWPTVTLQPMNPIEIQFVAGKTDTALLPQAVKQAIRLLGAAWYEHREEVVLGATAAVVSNKLAVGVDALVANWRLH